MSVNLLASGGTKGDCDPIDVCEIGYKVSSMSVSSSRV